MTYIFLYISQPVNNRDFPYGIGGDVMVHCVKGCCIWELPVLNIRKKNNDQASVAIASENTFS